MKKSCRAMAYQRVETMLRNQTAIERAVDEARAEQRGGHSGGGSSGHAFVSDPTAQQAVTAALPLSSVTLDNGYVVREPEKFSKPPIRRISVRITLPAACHDF